MELSTPRSIAADSNFTARRAAGVAGLIVVMLCGLMLSGCNTAEGVGRDVSATGAAVTRGASDVKTGL